MISDFKVAVVGGGISGLHTAYKLTQSGVSCAVYEARDRLGGRILSAQGFDLGPSWFWPGQRHIAELVTQLGLESRVFTQYAEGDALYQPMGAELQRGVQGISMSGSYRLRGGMVTLTQALEAAIVASGGVIKRGTPIEQVALMTDSIQLTSAQRAAVNGIKVNVDCVVMAMPPRVALMGTQFEPKIIESRQAELKNIDTWMAGHAKTVIVYDKPFWRNLGLSGDVFSQQGPLSEIHDASLGGVSGGDGSEAALFGFLGTPPSRRPADKQALDRSIIAQLVELFGEQAAKPKSILYKNWAADEYTATKRDQFIPKHHPVKDSVSELELGWHERLIWSGSEMASGHFNGYLEGALMASHQAFQHLSRLVTQIALGQR